MAPLSGGISLLLSIFCAVCFKSTVLGDCSFPATYSNRFWFLLYLNANVPDHYVFKEFTTNIVDNRTDNTMFNIYYSCWSIALDSEDPTNTLYYLYDDLGTPVCAKSTITSNAASILMQQIIVDSNTTNATQCSSFFTGSCPATCAYLWLTTVSSPSRPPPFVSSVACPFPGVYQLTASLNGSTIYCSGDASSTATIYSSNVQMNLCGQGGLPNTTFKTKTLLQDPLTCMGSLDGRTLNPMYAGSIVALLRDSNVLYCARFRNVSGGLELLIDVRNGEPYAGCWFNTSLANTVLQLTLSPMTSNPGITTTTTTLSTTTSSSSVASASDPCSVPLENIAVYEGDLNTLIYFPTSYNGVKWTTLATTDESTVVTLVNYDDTVDPSYAADYAFDPQQGLTIKNATILPDYYVHQLSTAGLYTAQCVGGNEFSFKFLVVRQGPTCSYSCVDSSNVQLTCNASYADSIFDPISAIFTLYADGKPTNSDTPQRSSFDGYTWISTSTFTVVYSSSSTYQCRLTFGTPTEVQDPNVAMNAPKFNQNCTFPATECTADTTNSFSSSSTRTTVTTNRPSSTSPSSSTATGQSTKRLALIIGLTAGLCGLSLLP